MNIYDEQNFELEIRKEIREVTFPQNNLWTDSPEKVLCLVRTYRNTAKRIKPHEASIK
jgi:hypothetical protein